MLIFYLKIDIFFGPDIKINAIYVYQLKCHCNLIHITSTVTKNIHTTYNANCFKGKCNVTHIWKGNNLLFPMIIHKG